MSRFYLFALFALLLLPYSGSDARADENWSSVKLEQFEGREIRELSFLTWINLPFEDLHSTLPLSEGEPLTADGLKGAVEALYLRDLFEHVAPRIRPLDDGIALQFVLTPVLNIGEVVFEGNKTVSTERLRRYAGIRSGNLLDFDAMLEMKRRLRREYAKEGFYHADVKLLLEEQIAEPEVDISIQIEEGYRSQIERFIILGEIPESVAYLKGRTERNAKGLPGAADTVESLRRALLLALRREGYLQASVKTEAIEYLPLSGNVEVRISVVTRDPISISFLGNEAFSAEELLQPLKLDTRAVPFSPLAIRRLAEEVRTFYQRHGYYFAAVKTERQRLNRDAGEPPGSRRHYLVRIEEGAQWHIEKILFEGNTTLSDSALNQRIELEKRGNLISRRWQPGFLVDEQLQADVEEIRRAYEEAGYYGTTVEADVERGKGMYGLLVRFRIKEAEGARIRSVTVSWEGLLDTDESNDRRVSNISDAQARLLTLQPRLRAGDAFKQAEIQAEGRALLEQVRSEGFPKAAIEIEAQPSSGEVRYIVYPGRRIRVGRIWLQGNAYTHDKVIKRNLSFDDGDLWDAQKMQRAQQDLYGLGFFRKVEIEPLDGSIDDPVEDLRVRVQERDTGSVELGASFTTQDGLFTTAQLAQRNLRGRGSALILGVDGFFKTGSRLFDAGRVRAAYAAPQVFGTNADFSLESFLHSNINLVDQFSYDRLGSSVALRSNLFEQVKGSLGLTAFHERLYDVKPDVIIGPEDSGSSVYSFVHGIVEYDGRDNIYNPRSGSRTVLDLRLAAEALGSDESFFAIALRESFMLPLTSRWVWANSVVLNLLEPFGETEVIPLGQRVFLGGRHSLRGFSKNVIGPRGFDGNIVGGDRSVNLQSEFRYDLTENLIGVLFMDIGQAFLNHRGSFSGTDTEFTDLRFSPGFGLHYKTPIGPISIELGFALDREFGERFGRFNLGVGTAF